MDNSEQTPQEASTPEQQIQPELAIPPTPPKRRPSKKIIALIVVGLVIMLAAGLALGWYLFGNDTPKETAKIVDTEQPVAEQKDRIKNPTPKDVIDDIQAELSTKYTIQDYAENSAPSVEEVSIYETIYSPPYKVQGYEYYVNYEGGLSLNIIPYDYNDLDAANPEKEDTIRQAIAKVYQDFGLIQKDTVGSEEYGSLQYIYENDTLVCSNAMGDGTTQASCGEKTKYKTEAELAAPLYKALIVENPVSAPISVGGVYGGVFISNSQTPGYQKAELGVGDLDAGGGYMALFYKKGDGPWTFFQGSQETIMCSEYNTDDIKNAFKGDECYTDTDATIGTVQ